MKCFRFSRSEAQFEVYSRTITSNYPTTLPIQSLGTHQCKPIESVCVESPYVAFGQQLSSAFCTSKDTQKHQKESKENE